jgi:hypothetical protein
VATELTCRHNSATEGYCINCVQELHEIITSYKVTTKQLQKDKNNLERERLIDLNSARTLLEGDDVPSIVVAIGHKMFKLQDKINDLTAELNRIKEGNLSQTEFMNLCHNLDKIGVTPEAHTQGCIDYQKKLYGFSNIEKMLLINKDENISCPSNS